MGKQLTPDLSNLPLHIRKVNKKWYIDTCNGKYIAATRIADHLPKPPPNHEQILEKRWDLR